MPREVIVPESIEDRDRLRAEARIHAREYAALVQRSREQIVIAAESVELYFTPDMDEDEKAGMRRWLVAIGRASWVIPRTELL